MKENSVAEGAHMAPRAVLGARARRRSSLGGCGIKCGPWVTHRVGVANQ
jgi:hypothetical protein